MDDSESAIWQSMMSHAKQLITVLVILALGWVQAPYLLRTEKPKDDDGHGHGAAAQRKPKRVITRITFRQQRAQRHPSPKAPKGRQIVRGGGLWS